MVCGSVSRFSILFVRNAVPSDIGHIWHLLEQSTVVLPRNKSFLEHVVHKFPGFSKVAVFGGDICGCHIAIPISDYATYSCLGFVRNDQRKNGVCSEMMHQVCKISQFHFIHSGQGTISFLESFGFVRNNCDSEMWAGTIKSQWIPEVEKCPDDLEIIKMNETSADALAAYDLTVQDIWRKWLYEYIISSHETNMGKVALINGNIAGFAYLTDMHYGLLVTMYADTPAVATHTLLSLHKDSGPNQNKTWNIFLPQNSINGSHFVRELGFKFVDKAVLLYDPHRLSACWQKIYGVHLHNHI